MKQIHKDSRNEPRSLLRFRSTDGASYPGYVDKDPETGEERPLKRAIAKEQFGICCYCMRRIRVSEMTVEHYITQKHHSTSPLPPEVHAAMTLDYQNLLGSCNTAVRDCSGIRGNTWIQIDPRKATCESLVRFARDGRARSTDSTTQSEIDEILKLNQGSVVENRRQVIDLANQRLRRRAPDGTWTKPLIQKEIEFWLRPTSGRDGYPELQEYCMAAVHYLRSKIPQVQ